MDEMWSFVGSKSQQRWLWHAIDHHTRQSLAYVFGTREDEILLQLKELLIPFGIRHFYTDGWGAYRRHIRRYLSGGRCPAMVHKRFMTREFEDRFASQLSASRSCSTLRMSPFGIAPQGAEHGFEGPTRPWPIAMTQGAQHLGEDRG
jgi:IS1 family transposase